MRDDFFENMLTSLSIFALLFIVFGILKKMGVL